MRILFLTDDIEDYLPDSLFHGLRQLSYIELVDYPRTDFSTNSIQTFLGDPSEVVVSHFTNSSMNQARVPGVIKSGGNWELASLMPSSFRTSGDNGSCYCNGDHCSRKRA